MAELLLLKADNLYRSLSDNDLKNEDADYQSDTVNNPNGENRILKAQYLYDSVMYNAIDDIVNNTHWDRITNSENPFWPEILVAFQQKRKLLAGRNYFGFSPDFYLYAEPNAVRTFLDKILKYFESVEKEFDASRNNLAALIVGNNAAAIQTAIQTELINYESQKHEAEAEASQKKLEVLAETINDTLISIERNAEMIEETKGNEIDMSTCEPYITNYLGKCDPPTIYSEIELIEECAKEKPCDFGCWFGRVFSIISKIAEAVGSIFKLAISDFARAFITLESAFITLETADLFDGLKLIGDYANLAVSGETGTVKYDAGADAIGFDVDDTFKKSYDEGKNVVDNTKAIIDGVDSLMSIGSNKIAQEVASIKIDSDKTARGLQQSLTEIYAIQSKLASNPNIISLDRSRAHLDTLVDLIKYNQQLIRNIPELQRRHVIATQQYSLEVIEWELALQKKIIASSKLSITYYKGSD
jgi:hypothetical protein